MTDQSRAKLTGSSNVMMNWSAIKRRDFVGGECNYISQNMQMTSTSLENELPS